MSGNPYIRPAGSGAFGTGVPRGDSALLLLFSDSGLLLHEEGPFWQSAHLHGLHRRQRDWLYVDQHGGRPCLTTRLDEHEAARLGARSLSLRQFLALEGDDTSALPGRASQLLSWYHDHRYCGSCGGPTRAHARERALVCEPCRRSFYPRINPCMIVLVRRGRELLLARHRAGRGDYYSCLAGFIEVGETPEETVAREVREEVGIEVRSIQYVQSQSWPFPSQLMLGFFADYAGGELRPDGDEIVEAGWFSPESLPPVPSAAISVAGRLIRAHTAAQV